MKKLFAPLIAVGAALLAFFFDPVSGRRRRAEVVQRTGGFFRRRAREAGRMGRAVGAEAYGVTQKVTHLREEGPKELNDPAIARKVETEIFRDPDVPKGQINVSVRDGVVELRGEVPQPDMINELVEKARSVPEVRDVENLLHLPGTRAPMHQ
jgi:osmotically-inducible protein OsmY